MKPICQKVQGTLAGEGARALRTDEAARRHLENCPECFSVMESLTALDRALETLPALDAPDAAVSRLLARVEEEQPERGRQSVGGRKWLGGLAAAAAAGASQVRPVFWGLAAAAGAVAFIAVTVPIFFLTQPSDLPQAQDRISLLYYDPPEDPGDGVAGGVLYGTGVPPSSGEEDELGRHSAGSADTYRRQNEPLSQEDAERLRALGYIEMDRLERRLGSSQEQEHARRDHRHAAQTVGEVEEELASVIGPLPDEGASSLAGEQEPETKFRRDKASRKTAQVKADDAIAAADRDAQVALGLGLEGGVGGKRGDDLEDAEELVEDDPEDIKNLYAMANLYEKSGRADEAEGRYLQTLRENPGDPKACGALAAFYNKPLWDEDANVWTEESQGARRSRFEDAIRTMEHCATLAPDDPRGHYKVATFFWDKAYRDHSISKAEKNEYADLGIEAADKALGIRPDYWEAVISKGLLFRVKAQTAPTASERKKYEEQAQILQKQALDLRKEQQAAADAAADTSPEATARGSLRGSALRVGGKVAAPKKIVDVAPVYPDTARQARVQGAVILEVTLDREGRVTDARVARSVPLLDEAALAAVKQWRYQPTLLNGIPVPVTMTVTVRFRLSAAPEDDRSSLPGGDSTRAARAFLAERASTEGLAIQAPRGYWANTYLPGDPTLRLLQARLAAWDRSSLEAAAGIPLRLHDDALQTAQPFDPPRRGALALYLNADRRGIEGPGRMLVQVGLQGSARAGARRPAMNVGLVFDLRGELPLEVAAGMRALAFAFSQAREAGDRFQLVVAGRPGGVAVEPSEFKHGPLMVTLGRLLEGGAALDGESLDLVGAVAAAFEAVSRGNDPDAPLGSSTVVLITGQPLGSSTPTLARLAHQGAVAGIPLSVVGVGPNAPLREMDGIALAGQGSRRQLESRSEAVALVEQELASAAQVVARAVRLRIRLAPGVRLVEVVGSRRLGEPQARRVREAERSIDLRLSRNLGIEADRGEDEDGIQIVIPSFHAGDSHAILLDVVAPGPGPVAEVTARYKDIVELRNGVARASFRVHAGVEAEGPLERNVLKNLLAYRLSETLGRAGDCLRAGDPARAAARLESARKLRLGLGALRPAFAGDPELGRDIAMLGEYERLLRGSAATRPADRARLADSLIYAGWLKVLPRPAPVAALGA